MYRDVGNVITKYIEENGYKLINIDYPSIELTADMVSAIFSIVRQMCLIILETKQLDL